MPCSLRSRCTHIWIWVRLELPVDRLTNALDRLGERRDELSADGAGLVVLAVSMSPEQFGRRLNERIARFDEREGCDRLARQQRSNRFRTWTDQVTGILRLSGELDPETGLVFISALEAAVEAMFHSGVPPECPDGESRQDWLRAMALVRLVTGAGVACTACIIPTVMNSAGTVLDQGRATRLATKDQRRALRAMYETCAIPGCTVRSRHCEPHHVAWSLKHHGRPTSTTCYRSAPGITTPSTKAAGTSSCTPTDH